MDQGSILGIIGIVVAFIGSVVTIINHKRIKSSCCDKEISASLDIENTTPQLTIKVPVRPTLPESPKDSL